MANDVLKELDERIAASVAKMGQLRKENEQLSQRLADTERRYADAAAQIKQLSAERAQQDSERNEVRTRIEKILQRFDGIDLG
jgi:chromosome segregation ATPase